MAAELRPPGAAVAQMGIPAAAVAIERAIGDRIRLTITIRSRFPPMTASPLARD